MMKKCTFIFYFSLSITITSYSQDRHFAWTYESSVLPKGGIDIEPWLTYSMGREQFYNRLDQRLEFEIGLSNKIQTAFYFNSIFESGAVTDSMRQILDLKHNSEYSFSNEWKVNLMNPSFGPFGLALYGEYTINPKEVELEYKLIVDRKMMNGIISFNHVGEFEFEHELETAPDGQKNVEVEQEFSMENDLAYIHLPKPNFGFGMEVRNLNKFEENDIFSTISLGPTIFYAGNVINRSGWFIILNVQAMIFENSKDEYHEGKQFQGDFEKVQTRLILGFSF